MDVGDALRITAMFYDEDGDLTDPTEVGCWVLQPGGDLVEVALSSSSLGVMKGIFNIIDSGEHCVRIEATGSITAASERRFIVQEQRVVHT